MKILPAKLCEARLHTNIRKMLKKIIVWCWATLPRRIVSCLVIAGILLSSVWFLFLKPTPAEAGWFDEDWLYRKSVTITNNTTAETNVYISLDIGDTSDTSKFQADCGDIRFTKKDGTLLNYYISSGCGTASTIIHVLFDTLIAGAQTLYFYYGNPSIENGFETSGFSTQAGNYSVGAVGSEETGTGPVLWLKFDEGYGTTAYDSSEQNNDGIITNATWTDSGKFGKALNFDGSTSYVTVGDTNTTIKSVSLWIRPNSTIVTEEPIDLNGSAYVKITNGTVTAEGFTAPTIYVNGIAGATVTAARWNHIEVSSDTGIDASAVVMGKYSSTYFSGIIDEVKIYPYARTEEQIKRDYNQGASARFGKDDSWLTDGLVGYWKMDEGSWSGIADEVVDSSGAGNHGVRAGDATTTGTAKFGRAGTFDGTGDYAHVSVGTQHLFRSDKTITAWIRMTNIDVRNSIFSIGNTATDGTPTALFAVEDDNRLTSFGRKDSGSYDYLQCADLTMSADAWYFVTFVNNNSSDTGYKLYVNGTECSYAADSTGFYDDWNDSGGSGFFFIGSSYGGCFNGQIDDVRIYNRALTSFEVRRLYDWGPPPIAHWTMDEKTDNTCTGGVNDVCDSSENSNDGAINGNPVWKGGADCKFGNCLSFDGDGDYVDFGDLTDVEGIGGFTVTAWVYKSYINAPPSGDDYIFTKSGAGADTFYMRLTTSSYIQFMVDTSDTGAAYGYHSPALTSIGWYHVVGVYDGTNVMIYVNGVVGNSIGSATGTTTDSGHNLLIGHSGSSWDGSIDEVKIYNYARTQKQVMEDMLGSRPVVTERTGSPGSMVGYWKFDEGAGATAEDASGQGNDGTITNATWTTQGKFGRALSFAGDDDFVDVGDMSVNVNTVSLWVKPDSVAVTEYPLDLNGTAYVQIANGTVTGEGFALPTVYINGVAGASAVTTGWNHIVITTDTAIDANDVDIGRLNTTYFDGLIDEVKIYPFALSAEEVLLEYNRGKAVQMGAVGTESDGTTPSWSQSRAYCPPGFTGTCDPPIAEWKMDEKADDTCTGGVNDVCDTSANSNDGAINGNPVWKGAADCKYGSCLDFDGSGDYVSISGEDKAAPLTFSTWVKLNVNSVQQVVFYLGDGIIPGSSATDNFRLEIDENGKACATAQRGSGPGSATGTTTLQTGVWYHLVAVFFEDTFRSIYVNGIWEASDINAETPSGGKVIWRIGDWGGDTEQYFVNGLIDDVKIFDRALTQEEISWLYNKGKSVGRWKFDEGEGSTATDSSENNNSGTITGATWTASGKYNSALNLGGTDEYVQINNVGGGELNPKNISVCAWAKSTFLGDDNVVALWENGDATDQSYMLWLDYPVWEFIVSTAAGQTAANSTNNATAEWTHLCGTYDGSTAKLYVDGIEVGSNGSPTGDLKSVTASNDLYIGSKQGTNLGDFEGQIDEVKIYNYALTAEQVKIDYNQGAALRFGD